MTFGQKLSRPTGGGTMRPITASLNLWFDRGEVDAGITVTRASTKTRFNEFGVMETVSANELSIDYDPSSLRTSVSSLDVTLSTKTIVLDTAGFALGDTVRVTKTGDVNTYIVGDVVYISGSTIKITATKIGGSGTFSDWQVIKCNGAQIEPQATNLILGSDAPVTQNITTTAAQRTISFYGTGTITLSGTHAAVVTGTGAYPQRTTYTYTPSAGALTLTIAGTVQYAQDELGGNATSYIPTAASAVTRNADVAVMADTSWLGAPESTAIRKWLNGTHEFEEAVTYRDIDKWVPAHTNMHMLSEVVYPRALTAAQKAALAPDAAWMSAVKYNTALNNMRFFVGGASNNIYVTGRDGTQQVITLSANANSNHTITVPLPALIEWPLDTGLIEFNCYSNQLTGSIPDLSNNTALQRFICYTNQLTGSIPDLSNNTALQRFICNSNQLTGSIPDLSSNTALLYFYCHINQLTGSIPDLSSNTGLIEFYCYSNQLTGWTGGTVSATLGNFQAQSNLLTKAAVDAILAAFVAAGRTSASGTCILNLGGTGNAAPSATGITDKNTLISRGWTVTTN